MKKPEFVIGYLMDGGAFIQSIKVPKLLDWIKYLEPEELITFFQDLLELVIQIPRGKEDVETLEEFLVYWRELALEADRALDETHIDPEEAEIAAKAADILWKSLADSIGAALINSGGNVLANIAEAERELASPWIDIIEEEPEHAAIVPGHPREHYLAYPIFGLPFSPRIHNCLERENIKTVRDLVTKTDGELLAYKNFGMASLLEIKELLADMGLSPGMDLDEEDEDSDREDAE